MAWEIDFLKGIIDNLHNDKITVIMTIITALGNYGFIWIVIAALFIIMNKTRKMGLIMSISLFVDFITVNVIIKPLIDRARPFEVDLDILKNIIIELPTDASFPSGHTAAAFAAATSVFCCDRRYGIVMLILATIMGFSRLYFAVHFPTDVIGGLFIGVIIGIISYKISSKKIKNS